MKKTDLIRHGIGVILLILTLILLCTLPAYYLLQFIYRFTGAPPDPVAHMLTTLMGIIVLYFAVKLMSYALHCHGKKYNPSHGHTRHQHDNHSPGYNRGHNPPPPPPPTPTPNRRPPPEPRPRYDRWSRLQPRTPREAQSRQEQWWTQYWQPPQVLMDTFEALDRIASGDFNVLLEGDDYGYYTELTKRINAMAAKLASMESMRSDFVSNVSHEIQSPLTSIIGFAKLIRQDGITDDERCHYADIIEAESQRLSKLSENLLKLSLLDSEHSPYAPAPFRLDKLIENVLLTLEPQWSAKDLELDIDLEPVALTGDGELLSQVWINLLGNAIKFTADKGSLRIALHREADRAICTISDSGIGIDADSLPHIFERFYKADQSRDRSLGGNGLGLSLVKRIIDIHSGQVHVQSVVDEGTTFTVTLPGAAPV